MRAPLPLALGFLLLLSLGAGPCGRLGGITVTPSPTVREPPVPPRFPPDKSTEVVPTESPGLLQAPGLGEHVYYYQPDDLWYRYAYQRWYQAFSATGNWFVPDKVPDLLRSREPKRVLPTFEYDPEADEPAEEEL